MGESIGVERKGRSHGIKTTHTHTHTHAHTLTIKFIYFILTSLMYSQRLLSCQVIHSVSLRAQSFPLQVMGRGGKEMTSFPRACWKTMFGEARL